MLTSTFPDAKQSRSHNSTLFPDRFLFSFTPIITIRHPARVIPSFLRAFSHYGDDYSHPDFMVAGESFRLERLIFDSFKSFEKARAVEEGREPRTPIVVDGDKLVADPQGQMKKLKAGEAFLGSFNRSTGVIS
ncbi:hypothetical protein L218DRAFT_958399, partial [Marasmius fiardii PR-910]